MTPPGAGMPQNERRSSMKLVPWKRNREQEDIFGQPDTSLARLRGEMDNLFDRFFRDPWGAGAWDSPLNAPAAAPRMDLAESENDVTVTMELPGVDPKAVQIDVVGDVLTVRGEKKQEKEERRRNVHYTERQYGSFQRTVQLPHYVDADKVDASYREGLLTITMPKKPGAQPKRITVKSE
jgi:HSP20 family protein